MAQLRQFYMRMMDPTDSWSYAEYWENSRGRYIERINDQARNKDGGPTAVRAPGEDRNIDTAIKDVTKEHSDLTFLSFPKETGREVILYPERTGGSRRNRNQTEKGVTTAKYRHILYEDNYEQIPFAS